MIITPQIMEAGKSVNGGWNLEQVKCLGYKGWEYKWKRKAIGKDVPEEDVKRFLMLKDAHTNGISKNSKGIKFEPVNDDIKYSEQYKHPNWQKMRLVVLKRDSFACKNCGTKSITLHAHHLKYIKGKHIWEVPHWYIVTLCEDCHSEEHGRDLRIK